MPEKESHSEKNFPDWNNLYSSQNVETMPWYNENLGRILDLGTGPATQAIQLAKRGLHVTGSDVSDAAINRAMEVYVHDKEDKEISFTVDDILNSKIKALIMYLTEVVFMFCLYKRGQFISEK